MLSKLESELIRDDDIELILLKKFEILEKEKNVSDERNKEVIQNIHEIAGISNLQFLIQPLSYYAYFQNLLKSDAQLQSKIAHLKNPFEDRKEDPSVNAENIYFAKLVDLASKKLVYTFDELSTSIFGINGAQQVKEVQKLVMKSVQTNVLHAVISQKDKTVTF